jgi:hypothetical protein
VRAPQVKVGDKVLFGKYSGTEVKLDGTDLLVVKEDDIFAILGCRASFSLLARSGPPPTLRNPNPERGCRSSRPISRISR